MRYVDARRLTGPNLLRPFPLAVCELAFDAPDEAGRGIAAFGTELARMRSALGLAPIEELVERRHRGGVMLAYRDATDVLLVSAEANEWAAMSAAELVAGRPALSLDPRATELRALLDKLRSPNFCALESAALSRGVNLLWDDDLVTLGSGKHATSWPRDDLPRVDAIDWTAARDVPTVLVTGTNGKTTTARLLAFIGKSAGFRTGATSTDGLVYDGALVKEGDYTGPIAAREVLRRNDVDVAVLETARGGILRRGLAMPFADAAIITNVSADHLGDSGIDDVQAMADVKAVVGTVVRPTGRVVLNASDPNLVRIAPRFRAPIAWFSAGSEAIGDESWIVRDGMIVHVTGDRTEPIVRVSDVPITFGGAATYNVENALAAAAAAHAIGISIDVIASALCRFDASLNPGRGQLHDVGGVRVFLDFGHNPEGVRAALGLARRLLSKDGRLFVVTGAAGDRTDSDIADVAKVIASGNPHGAWVRELHGYERGRAEGEVPRVFAEALRACGVARVGIAGSEIDAIVRTLEEARAGDVLAVLVHLDHDEVAAFLATR